MPFKGSPIVAMGLKRFLRILMSERFIIKFTLSY